MKEKPFYIKKYRGKTSLYFGDLRIATIRAEWLANELAEALNARGIKGGVTIVGDKVMEYGFTRGGTYVETHR